MTITTINTPTGTINIDNAVFLGYNQEALELLGKIDELTKDFAEIVETVSETTELKKATVAKYFKERFKERTKATKETGELFSLLDDVLDA